MSYKTYVMLRVIVVIIMTFLAAWAVASGNVLVLIPVAIAGIAMMLTLRKRVKEVIVDERVYSISDKTSRVAVRISVALLVVAGAVCITLREGMPQLFQIGLTLTCTACGLLLVYWVSYIYYSRKMGGGE